VLKYSVQEEPIPRDLLTFTCGHYGFIVSLRFSLGKGKGKGKAHPRKGHKGPEGE